MLDSPPDQQNAVNNLDNDDAAADHDPVLRVLGSPPDLQNAVNNLDNNAAADHDPLLRVLLFLLINRML